MAINRRLIAQDSTQEAQWLKIDHSSRYIENHLDEWQFLFGPNSELDTSSQIVKLAARFNDNTFANIQIVGYLYDTTNASISNSNNCVFRIYKVNLPDWSETLITTLNGTQLPNFYYYINPTTSSLTLDFQGGDTLMIDAIITRLGVTYRDRIYINHLGIFDNVTRLKNEIDFLFITKKDL